MLNREHVNVIHQFEVSGCNTPDHESHQDHAGELAQDCLNILFPYAVPIENKRAGNISQTAADIHDALSGNSKMRINRAPEGPAKEKNVQRICDAIKDGAPIPLVTVIGTAKLPQGDKHYNSADLMDFAALHTIEALQRRVQAVYQPGIIVRAFFEDAVGLWLFGEDSAQNQDHYSDSLNGMYEAYNEAINHNLIFCVRETTILEQMGYGVGRFLQECAVAEGMFRDYIFESQQIIDQELEHLGYTDWASFSKDNKERAAQVCVQLEGKLSQLESYQRLQTAGWRGVIPPEMREFYIRRFETNALESGDNYDQRLSYLAKYYASTLVKAQIKTPYLSLTEDNQYQFNPGNSLKLAFIGLAPGIPVQFQDAFQMRAAYNDEKRGGVDNSTAPWRTHGGVLVDLQNKRARLDARPPRLALQSPEDFESTIVLKNGSRLRAPLRLRK